jgi:hypothetical protein
MEELRENFSIKSFQIKMELELLLLEKRKIERLLRDAIRQEASEIDFFATHVYRQRKKQECIILNN